MTRYESRLSIFFLTPLIILSLLGCKSERKEPDSKPLLDLNAHIRPYVTVETSTVRTGPGHQFRAIGEIRRDAKDPRCRTGWRLGAHCFEKRQPTGLHRAIVDRTRYRWKRGIGDKDQRRRRRKRLAKGRIQAGQQAWLCRGERRQAAWKPIGTSKFLVFSAGPTAAHAQPDCSCTPFRVSVYTP